MNRPSKDQYYLSIAKACAQRSTCLRRKFGAVIVKDDRIVSTGYNGAPRGVTNCSDIGECPRNAAGCEPGDGYQLCPAVHAEQNSLIAAAPGDMLGATMYISGVDANDYLPNCEPCVLCKRMIVNAGVEWVIIPVLANVDNIETILVSNWAGRDAITRTK
jgi:dCMP deaminase